MELGNNKGSDGVLAYIYIYLVFVFLCAFCLLSGASLFLFFC